MTTATIQPIDSHPTQRRLAPWWPWAATAFAFPPAGYLAHELVGAVDAPGPAALNGVVTGALLGVAQWAVLRRRGVSARWIAATAAGFGVGLSLGAALVGYDTSLAALATMGAVCGLVIGFAQGVSHAALRRSAHIWTVATGTLWALGWAVTTSAGIDVESQYPVFGASGALVVAMLQSVLVNRLVPAAGSDRRAASRG